MIAESEREAMGVDIAFVHQGEMRKSLKKREDTLIRRPLYKRAYGA